MYLYSIIKDLFEEVHLILKFEKSTITHEKL